MLRSDEEILRELKEATEGLSVMSESDYPLEIVRWNGQTTITPDYLRRVSGAAADCQLEETDLDTFFHQSEKFRNVVDLIKDNLSGVKVYKVGLINIPVFIVGRSPDGNWLGLSTRVVET